VLRVADVLPDEECAARTAGRGGSVVGAVAGSIGCVAVVSSIGFPGSARPEYSPGSRSSAAPSAKGWPQARCASSPRPQLPPSSAMPPIASFCGILK
jgi:hypothetical protein